MKLLPSTRGSSLAAVAVVAVLAYINTLVADFTFDDNFAVINNGDVTNSAIPTKDLFKHDFWGQDITSSQSHKSYRPITILAFRLTHRAWCLITAVAPGITQLLPRAPAILPIQDDDSGRAERPQGLHPFPFHVLCVCMHAIASVLVLALCQHLFAALEDSSSDTQHTVSAQPAPYKRSSAQQAATYSPCTQGYSLRELLMWQQQQPLWRVPRTAKYTAQALLAGLMFALHPIHTEAVAGVVGCAELICAALSCPALLLYFMAADGRYAAATYLKQDDTSSAAAATTATAGITGKQASKPRGSSHKTQQGNGPAVQAGVAGGTVAGGAQHQQQLLLADTVQHWLLVTAAAVLALTAALSKEIGITVIGTMLMYDLVLIAPYSLRQQHSPHHKKHGDSLLALQAKQGVACRRQLLRMLCIAATAVTYVKLRQWVAVEQLVAIYRKVENPIPFAASRLTRVLSTGYLHARYFWLLLLPLRLSADWSFNCIPLVEHATDPQNLATLALYCYFLYLVCCAQPLALLQQLMATAQAALGGCAAPAVVQESPDPAAQGSASSSAAAAAASGCARSRWRLMVLVGLLIAPFFPASNVLFYVGTFIGERLLYSPSIGFCLLAADLLGGLIPDTVGHQQQQQQEQQQEQGAQQRNGAPATAAPPADLPHQQKESSAVAGKEPATAAGASAGAPKSAVCSPQQQPSTTSRSGWVLLLVVSVVLLSGYAARTVVRNTDWWDEERLFLAALRVCPNSAKVQQNCGVLQRRYKNYTAALEHFRHAQEIEPGYCEPSYWIGLTTLNNGDPASGVAAIKASLSCRYTAAEALTALNKVYVMMMEAGRNNEPSLMTEWAGVLASPHVLRVADACATAEDAALAAALMHKSTPLVMTSIDVCLQGLHEWEHGAVQPDSLAGVTRRRLAASTNTSLLSECVSMRRAVYKKLASSTVDSRPVRRAVYRYMARVSKGYAACRTLAGGGPVPTDAPPAAQAAPTPSSHQKLLHKVQSADPEDPWLQAEWGLTLLALGAQQAQLHEAALHLGVAAAMFSQAAQELQAGAKAAGGAGGGGGGRGISGQGDRQQLTELDGRTPLTALTALEAAMQALEVFQAATASSRVLPLNVRVQVCELLQRLCHIKLQVVMVLQQQQHQAVGGSKQRASSLQAATAAAQRCLAELSARPGCEEQAAALRDRVRINK